MGVWSRLHAWPAPTYLRQDLRACRQELHEVKLHPDGSWQGALSAALGAGGAEACSCPPQARPWLLFRGQALGSRVRYLSTCSNMYEDGGSCPGSGPRGLKAAGYCSSSIARLSRKDCACKPKASGQQCLFLPAEAWLQSSPAQSC